ncbi:MAG TPA: DUF2085 domain-containing protein [Thermoplasmatales archaeon]|nr:DUF2085 domain-containing protein [Thermoplasmatales archaeon]
MEKRVNVSKMISLLSILLLLWVILQFLAPYMFPPNTIQNLSGLPGVEDNAVLIRNMSYPWNIVYSIGDRLCHQRSDRSFFLNENQMPFCARCTGIWLGLAIGLGVSMRAMFGLSERLILFIVIGILPLAIDGLFQLFGLWESNNILRVTTGVLAGFTTGIAIAVIVDEIRETQFFQKFFK